VIFDAASGLAMVGVWNRGVPNRERVVLVATEQTNLGKYALVTARRTNQGYEPQADHFHWFQDQDLAVGVYVVVFTGSGQAGWTTLQGSGALTWVVHAGYPHVLYANTSIVPLLVEIGGISPG
jgi:hypothetical protein